MNTITIWSPSPWICVKFLTSPPAAALLDNSLFGCVNQNVDTSLKLSNKSFKIYHQECKHFVAVIEWIKLVMSKKVWTARWNCEINYVGHFSKNVAILLKLWYGPCWTSDRERWHLEKLSNDSCWMCHRECGTPRWNRQMNHDELNVKLKRITLVMSAKLWTARWTCEIHHVEYIGKKVATLSISLNGTWSKSDRERWHL